MNTEVIVKVAGTTALVIASISAVILFMKALFEDISEESAGILGLFAGGGIIVGLLVHGDRGVYLGFAIALFVLATVVSVCLIGKALAETGLTTGVVTLIWILVVGLAMASSILYYIKS